MTNIEKKEVKARAGAKSVSVNYDTCSWQKVVKSLQTPHVEIVKFEPGGKAEKQARFHAKESKKSFFYPVRDKEVPGVDREWCIMNGLRFLIAKGVYVELPISVADHLMECLNQTAAASSNVKVDIDGRQVNARLDLQSDGDRRAVNG